MHTSLLGRRRRLAKGGQGLLQGSLAVLADGSKSHSPLLCLSIRPTKAQNLDQPKSSSSKAPNREQAQVCNEVQPSLPALLGYSCIYLPRTLPQCDISHFQLILCSFLVTHTQLSSLATSTFQPSTNLSNKSNKHGQEEQKFQGQAIPGHSAQGSAPTQEASWGQ